MSGHKRAVTPGDHQRRRYQELVKRLTPPRPVLMNCLRAFLVGGVLCAAGQLVLDRFRGLGLGSKDAAMWTSTVFVSLGALLTGFGIYDRLGKIGGMGAALPISGFGNSVAAPAMEFRREGWVLGVGSRMFTIAGPVLLYGLLASALVASARHLLNGMTP